MDKRLLWLGDVSHMSETRLPSIMLFGEMKKKRPANQPRKSWRDLVSNDLNLLGIDGWYELCQDRDCWYQRCQEWILYMQRIYVRPTGSLKVDLSHVNVGELSAELETIQDIKSSACHILNALPRLRYHHLIIVKDLRFQA